MLVTIHIYSSVSLKVLAEVIKIIYAEILKRLNDIFKLRICISCLENTMFRNLLISKRCEQIVHHLPTLSVETNIDYEFFLVRTS